MGSRIELQFILQGILGSSNVYFQPPESININYPAIIYELSDIETSHANNKVYRKIRKYSVTAIEKHPDSVLVDKLLELPMCEFNRHFETDNLNHNVFNLYF